MAYILDCPRCGESEMSLLICLTAVLKNEDGTGVKFAPSIRATCTTCGKYVKFVEVNDETVEEATLQAEALLSERECRLKAEKLGLEKLPFEE